MICPQVPVSKQTQTFVHAHTHTHTQRHPDTYTTHTKHLIVVSPSRSLMPVAAWNAVAVAVAAGVALGFAVVTIAVALANSSTAGRKNARKWRATRWRMSGKKMITTMKNLRAGRRVVGGSGFQRRLSPRRLLSQRDHLGLWRSPLQSKFLSSSTANRLIGSSTQAVHLGGPLPGRSPC